HIQQVGRPEDVYHKPANTFVARFIGAPSMNLLPGNWSDEGVKLESGRRLEIPMASAPKSAAVMLGVRPDDLLPGSEAPLISGTVTVREPLGHDTLIYVDTPAGEVTAKADGRTPPQVGETVDLGADTANLHLFDTDTGMALT
ncbi:MAG: TOBE domain-containing protein, partial [Marinosulfonomonas sp.]|nr:TOBE domain-containing protein [Marinosulfonomonas sp.]